MQVCERFYTGIIIDYSDSTAMARFSGKITRSLLKQFEIDKILVQTGDRIHRNLLMEDKVLLQFYDRASSGIK